VGLLFSFLKPRDRDQDQIDFHRSLHRRDIFEIYKFMKKFMKKPRSKFIFRKTAVFGQAKEKELREVRILCGLIESWRDVLYCTGIVRPQEMKKAVYQ